MIFKLLFIFFFVYMLYNLFRVLFSQKNFGHDERVKKQKSNKMRNGVSETENEDSVIELKKDQYKVE